MERLIARPQPLIAPTQLSLGPFADNCKLPEPEITSPTPLETSGACNRVSHTHTLVSQHLEHPNVSLSASMS